MTLKSVLAFYLVLSGVACDKETSRDAQDDQAKNNQVLSRPLDVSGSYVINPVTGDSIEPILDQNGQPLVTMKPTVAKGSIDEFYQLPTKVVPAQWQKLDKKLNSSIRTIQVDTIQTPLIYDTLTVVKDEAYVLKSAIGDTILTGVPVRIEGKNTPVKYPQPVSSLPPELHYESGLNLKRLGVDQGLSMESTTGMVEDRFGNKWISYLGMGLSKYDGNTFWHFTEKEGLPSTTLWGIFQASDGKLWLNTLNEGVIVFDGEHFINYSVKEGFPGNGVRRIFEDSKGNIWLIRQYGVSKYDGTSFTHFTTREGLVDNAIIRIFEDRYGIIWMVGIGKVSRYDGTGFTNFAIRHPEGTGYINPLFEDHEGNLWLSSEHELLRYDGTSFTRFPASLREFRLNWQEDPANGHIWISYYSEHIYKFDGGHFWEYSMIDENNNSPIEKIEKDEAGNIWFCTAGLGVYILNEILFTSISELDGLAKKGTAEKLWITRSPGPLEKYENGTLWRLIGSEARATIGPILEDRRENIWLGLYRGLARYDGQTISYYRAETNQSLHTTRSIIEDRTGNIWLALNDGVIVKYDGEQFIQYNDEDGLPHQNYTQIIQDRNHHLWFSTEGGGIVKFDGQSFTVFSEKEGLSSNYVICMTEDQEGNIWMGTNGRGVMKFDGASFMYYTENHGLSNNFVTTLVVDHENRIWAGTHSGLNLFVPKIGQKNPETSEILKGKYMQQDYAIYPYDKKDGLIENEVGWHTLTVDENNFLWGTLDGKVFKLDISHLILPQDSISVHLDHLDLNGRFIDFRDAKENLPSGIDYAGAPPFFNYPSDPSFSYKNNHLTFHYTATDWSAPHKIQYSYQLLDADAGWSVPSSETKADFRNLSPGSHTFAVRAMGQSRIWSEPLVYTFRILPPWWLTWWAFTLYLLMIAAIIRAAYLFLLRRQFEKQETENLRALDAYKTKLYTNITHEFRTPLTIISGMASQIIENPTAWAKKGGEMIRQNSANLLNLVNQILDLRKLEAKKLKLNMVQGDVVRYLRYLFESHVPYAQGQGIEMHFLPAIDELVMDFDPEKLLSILSNLFSNAIKYTPDKGNIYFHLNQTVENGRSFLRLRVQDTGTGIPADQLPYIFDRFYQVDGSTTRKGEGTGIGLALTKEMVKLMNGSIEVKSTLGHGTVFTVSLPVTNDSPIREVLPQTAAKFDIPMVSGPLVHPSEGSVYWTSELSNDARTTGDLPTLLIVEDNPDIRLFLMACLENNYQLETASNGQEGIDLALEMVPDLIISDVMMPEKDGFALCETLKNDERTSHVPIILLTAKADVESKISGLSVGADAYLTKPFEQKELMVRLEKLFELRQKLQVRYRRFEPETVPESREDEFVQKVRQVVLANISDETFGIAQLCRSVALSRAQLHNKLKALTGQSTSHFVRSIRLFKAKELLESSDLNVSEVGYEVGFKNPSHFSSAYQEEFGISPSKTRK